MSHSPYTRPLLLVTSGFVCIIIGLLIMSSSRSAHLATRPLPVVESTPTPTSHPLSLSAMRARTYPGSELAIESTIGQGDGYTKYDTSYLSDGYKIYGLLTVPTSSKPAGGYPVIVFNHGFIPPTEYRTTERYVAYQDAFARAGYITFKSDYRGHGRSEGPAEGAYFAPGYTVDVLNAVAMLKQHPDADPARIGMWGHSLGGNITQRALVIDPTIKAAVIWGGVVGSYPDIFEVFFGRRRFGTSPSPQTRPGSSRQRMIEMYGTPSAQIPFWRDIDPMTDIAQIAGPVQQHHARGDETVPYELAVRFDAALTSAGKQSELYLYEGDDHNLSANLNLALTRSVAFFDLHLKK